MAKRRGGLADWIAGAALPVLVLDARQRVRVFNRGASQLTGVAPGDVLGRKATLSQEPSPADQVLDACTVVTSQFAGQPTTVRITIPTLEQTVERTALVIPLEPEEDVSDGHVMIVLTQSDWAEVPRAEPLVPHAAVRSAAAALAKRYRLRHLIASAPAMERVVRQLAAATSGTMSVWVAGPSGSGRTHLARTILSHSTVPPERQLVLEGSVLDDDAVTAQLDTLPPDAVLLCEHLDEWSATGWAALQQCLAGPTPPRVIATGSVGGGESLPETLGQLVSDLVIHVPRLQDRTEDIPLLAQTFLEREHVARAVTTDAPLPISFTREAVVALERYSWPGEVRELARVVAAAVESYDPKSSPNEQVSEAELPSAFRIGVDAERLAPTQPVRPLVDILEAAEREHLQLALDAAGGQKAKAAKLLGMSRPKLYRRLEQLGFD